MSEQKPRSARCASSSVDKLRPSGNAAFQFKIMLKRLDNFGGNNWRFGQRQCPIKVKQIPAAPTLKQCPQFCSQHFVDVIAR
jgi:hypothetical protein